MVILSIQKTIDSTDFWRIIETGTTEELQRIITTGINVNKTNKYGTTPLIETTRNNNLDMVISLINAGTDVNLRNAYDKPILLQAVRNEAPPEVLSELIKAGVDINYQYINGLTALMYASYSNTNPEVINTILDSGVDGSIKDNLGRIAFDLAKENPAIQEQQHTGNLMRPNTNNF